MEEVSVRELLDWGGHDHIKIVVEQSNKLENVDKLDGSRDNAIFPVDLQLDDKRPTTTPYDSW